MNRLTTSLFFQKDRKVTIYEEIPLPLTYWHVIEGGGSLSLKCKMTLTIRMAINCAKNIHALKAKQLRYSCLILWVFTL